MRVLCTICMRGGSKGVPSKNLKILNGKPLMAYTIEQALESNLFDHVVVSSDSNSIIDISKTYGAKSWFKRPASLSSDNAPKLPVIQHALKEAEREYGYKFDVLVDLDATSPLRNVSDIIDAYDKFINEKANILISASPARKNPYFNMVELNNGKVDLVKKVNVQPTRRQDAPKVYDMNASIYIWRRNTLLNGNSLFSEKTCLYVMPEDRSVDIDTEFDWQFVEYLIQNKAK